MHLALDAPEGRCLGGSLRLCPVSHLASHEVQLHLEIEDKDGEKRRHSGNL